MFFLFLAVYLFYGIIAGKLYSAHAYCPYAVICFGVLQFSFTENMVFLFTGAIVLGLLISISTMFIGRKFCGYVCPIGTVQELLFKLRSKKYRLKKRVPFFYEKKFVKIKYFILLITALLVIIAKSPLYMNFCPVLTIARFPNIVVQGLILLFIIVAGSLLTERFWCRFLCPMAALMNVFQKIGKLFGFKRLLVNRNLESCIDCCICSNNCSMNINILNTEIVDNVDCIHCLICVGKCPRKNTLNEKMVKRDCYE